MNQLKMTTKNIEALKKEIKIPISIFDDRRLGVLESLVLYLKTNQSLKNSEIARILNRDSRTIWTVYSRVKKKVKIKD